MNAVFEEVFAYVSNLPTLEFLGLIFGLLTVLLLIRGSIWNWPFGISYVLVSLVVFWEQRLYGDLLLHLFFLVLNIYGWYYWASSRNHPDSKSLPITTLAWQPSLIAFGLSIVGIGIFGFLLASLPRLIAGVPAASLPYWDASTSVLSVTAMWLTARKKIENWYYWFLIDVLATGIYWYKGIYFYSLLYFVYIGMAVSGYLSWKKAMAKAKANV